MNPVPIVVAALCLGPAAELKLKTHDWTQFRGPTRTGVSAETGLLKEWPKDGPPKVWTVTGCGQGYSTVSVAGGVVFGTGKMKDGQEHVWARDEATGQVKWSIPFVKAREDSRSTPTYAAGKVYAVGMGGTLVCVDATTGKVVWSRDYVKEFGGSVPGWGYCESVLVDDGKVIGTPCSDSAAMVALDAATGKTLWQTKVPDTGGAGGYASPVKMEVGGTKMYVNLLGDAGGVVGVDAKTGRLLWQYKGVMNGTANIPSPIVKGDLVFASTGYGAGAALLQVTGQGGKFAAKELKRHKGGTLQNHHGGMVLLGDHVYLGSQHNEGFPACVELKTGEVKWAQQQGAAGGDGSAATAAADGMVYFRYENGVIALIKADPDQYTLVSSFQLPEKSGSPSWPHPTIANGKLYIRDQDKLHVFNLKATGK